jgi:hypothetical protein
MASVPSPFLSLYIGVSHLITISRNLARQIASVTKRTLSLSQRQFSTHVARFQAGPDGLTITATTTQAAVQYHDSTPCESCELFVPLECLKTVGNIKDEPATLESIAGQLQAKWQDGAVPRTAVWPFRDAQAMSAFPPSPGNFVENSPELLIAISEAMLATDANPTRFALNCLRLSGSDGSIAATDGRQIYKQSGFNFGFEEEVLFYPSPAIVGKELPTKTNIGFARTEEHIVLRNGPWTFYQPIEKDRRFPRIEDVIPRNSGIGTTLKLSRTDAKFLNDSLNRLPAIDETNQPVTVDLNGRVAIRARSAQDAQPTELVLQTSQRNGREVRLATDRRFLSRAIELGFESIYFDDDNHPAVCDDGHRTFVWALLAKDGIVAPAPQSTIIESPISHSYQKPSTEQPHAMKTKTTPPPKPEAPEQIPSDSKPSKSPIEQAVTFRDELRNMLGQANELIRSLKRQKQQQRLMQSTINQLKQIQAVG